MQTRKSPGNKSELSIAEAAEKTGILLRGLQTRLAERPAMSEPSGRETDTLERELHEYFQAQDRDSGLVRHPLSAIRSQVIDGVVERILRSWESPQRGEATAFENEVVERLIERVLERLNHAGTAGF